MTLDEILKNICSMIYDINLIKSGSRKRYFTTVKVELIKAAIDQFNFYIIGNFLGSISVSYI
jgi:hypothetical protein